ncbi:thioesterase II family protein [Actinophytocola glycyrrhizae]|uniref:Thioesterase II family protein n=1 Tax=Actinophytocola glycyrrhizae TaxID=2044873 RepID=A0ABV9SBV3_9PSEU
MPPRQMVLFPFAGGSSHAFTPLVPLLRGLDPMLVDYPGHHLRSGEPLLNTVPDLAGESLYRIGCALRPGYVVLGASLGALVAFEFSRQASAIGRRPSALVVLSAAAPNRIASVGRFAHLADDEFSTALRERYPGQVSALATDPEVREFVLPVLRADIEAFEDYGDRAPGTVDVPMLVLGGLQDRSVRYADLLAWTAHSTRPVVVRRLDGGHFLISDSVTEVAGDLLTWFKDLDLLPECSGST